MAHPCGCGLFVLEGPGNCSGSSGRQWARRPRLSDGLFVDQGGVGLSRPQRPHFTTRTKIQGGGEHARGKNRAAPPDKSDKERGEVPQWWQKLPATRFMGLSTGSGTNPAAVSRVNGK